MGVLPSVEKPCFWRRSRADTGASLNEFPGVDLGCAESGTLRTALPTALSCLQVRTRTLQDHRVLQRTFFFACL